MGVADYLQFAVSGLTAGSIYALVAVGLVLIFQATDVLNFGYGEIAMLATFVALQVMNWGGSYAVGVLSALVAGALLGMFLERVVIRPIMDAPIWTVVTATFGISLVLHSVAGEIWHHDPLVFPSVFPRAPLEAGGVRISPLGMATLGFTLLLLVLLTLYGRTKAGIAMRAVVQDRMAAQLMGVRVGRVFSSAWAIGAIMGTAAAVLIAPLLFLTPSMMQPLLLKALTAATVGGLTSMTGAVIGGLGLGVVESFVGLVLPSDFKDTVAFVVILLVLLLRPAGLFGRRAIVKV